MDFHSGQKETTAVATTTEAPKQTMAVQMQCSVVKQCGMGPSITDGSQWWGEELSVVTLTTLNRQTSLVNLPQ